jgi:hypothetical protein
VVARSKGGVKQESNLEAAIAASDGACARVPHRRSEFFIDD